MVAQLEGNPETKSAAVRAKAYTDVLDVSPAFAGVVMAVTLIAASVPQIGSAFLMPFLLTKFHTWSVPFIVASGVNVFSALLWALCASGRRAAVDHTGGSYLRV